MFHPGHSLRISAIAGIAALFALATSASAGLVNSSFESPVVSGPDYISHIADGWTIGGQDGGVLNPAAHVPPYGGTAPNGHQVGWTLGNTVLYQDVGPITAGVTYKLSTEIGARFDIPFGDNYRLLLGYGGHDLATTTVFAQSPSPANGGTVPVIPAPGTYALVSLVGTAPKTASGDLLIFLDGGTISTGQAASQLWDNVSVTTAIPTPEPGSLTLLGLGLASLGGFGWLKKRMTKVVAA